MTWKEVKDAVEELGIKETDEICLVECKFQDCDKTLHKSEMGKKFKLTEGISQETKDYKGCAV